MTRSHRVNPRVDPDLLHLGSLWKGAQQVYLSAVLGLCLGYIAVFELVAHLGTGWILRAREKEYIFAH